MDHLCSLIRGVSIFIWGAFFLVLDCWWAQKKSRGCGGTGPCRPPSPQSPPEVYVIYSVWEQIDPLLFEQIVSRLPFHCLSLIKDLWRAFLCTHTHIHIPAHSAQSSPCSASVFWQGGCAVMNVSFPLWFHDLGCLRAETCAVLLTGDKSTVNETLAKVWDVERTLLSFEHFSKAIFHYHKIPPLCHHQPNGSALATKMMPCVSHHLAFTYTGTGLLTVILLHHVNIS